LQDPSRFTQIWIFGLKKYHLATLGDCSLSGLALTPRRPKQWEFPRIIRIKSVNRGGKNDKKKEMASPDVTNKPVFFNL
jgi:hypothetical protein